MGNALIKSENGKLYQYDSGKYHLIGDVSDNSFKTANLAAIPSENIHASSNMFFLPN